MHQQRDACSAVVRAQVEFLDEDDILYKQITLEVKCHDPEVLKSYTKFVCLTAAGLDIKLRQVKTHVHKNTHHNSLSNLDSRYKQMKKSQRDAFDSAADKHQDKLIGMEASDTNIISEDSTDNIPNEAETPVDSGLPDVDVNASPVETVDSKDDSGIENSANAITDEKEEPGPFQQLMDVKIEHKTHVHKNTPRNSQFDSAADKYQDNLIGMEASDTDIISEDSTDNIPSEAEALVDSGLPDVDANPSPVETVGSKDDSGIENSANAITDEKEEPGPFQQLMNVNIKQKAPKVYERQTLLASVHIYKKHQIAYEARTHFKVLDMIQLTGSTADTFLEYIQRNLPEGLAMKVTKHRVEKFPAHLEHPPAANQQTDAAAQ